MRVAVAGHAAMAPVTADGTWLATLPPLAAGGPHELLVECGGETVRLADVLVGDVWLCSGQSNMQMPVRDVEDAAREAARAKDYPTIRLLAVPKAPSDRRMDRIGAQWTGCTTESVGGFSAVGWFFGRDLHDSKANGGVPIGLIDSSFGGTMVEAWMSTETLRGKFAGEELRDSMFGFKPASMYNGMIAPLAGFPLKGVLWYQGESNAPRPEQYARLLAGMIGQWRADWGQPDMPFLLVGLANYTDKFLGMHFTFLREAQARVARKVPGVWLAMGYDTADGFDLHPKQKAELGRRLALLARRHVYGEPLVADSPTMKSVRVEGNTARVEFDTTGGLAARGGGEVRGFTVADADGQFRNALARIEGDEVVLEAEGVAVPQFVRYAWSGNPDANLVNGEGLPAAPFRTDAFDPLDLEVERQAAGREVKLDEYEVRIDGDGTLWSITAGGREFLAGPEGDRRATGFHTFFGAARLYNLRDSGPAMVSAGNETAQITYRFEPARMEWLLHNRGKDPLPFRVAFADGAVLVVPEMPQPSKSEWSERAPQAVVSLGGRALDIVGMDRVYGSLGGAGITAEARLKPGEARSISVLPRLLTPDESARVVDRLEQIAAGLPRLLLPEENAVFQRDGDGRAAVPVSGRVALPCAEASARLVPGLPGCEATPWTALSVDAQSGAIAGRVAAPTSGWYSLEVRAGGGKSAPLITRRVAVGDVFVFAGAEPRIVDSKTTTPAGDFSMGNGSEWVTDADTSSFPAHLAAALASRFGVPVGLVDIADPGGALGAWEAGTARHRLLTDTIRSAGPHGLRAVAWQPSPFDAFTSPTEYMDRLRILASSQVAAVSWEVPVVAGMFRGSEGKVAQPASGTLRLGPAVNAADIAWRDGALTAAGASMLAARWAEAIAPEGRQAGKKIRKRD